MKRLTAIALVTALALVAGRATAPSPAPSALETEVGRHRSRGVRLAVAASLVAGIAVVAVTRTPHRPPISGSSGEPFTNANWPGSPAAVAATRTPWKRWRQPSACCRRSPRGPCCALTVSTGWDSWRGWPGMLPQPRSAPAGPWPRRSGRGRRRRAGAASAGRRAPEPGTGHSRARAGESAPGPMPRAAPRRASMRPARREPRPGGG